MPTTPLNRPSPRKNRYVSEEFENPITLKSENKSDVPSNAYDQNQSHLHGVQTLQPSHQNVGKFKPDRNKDLEFITVPNNQFSNNNLSKPSSKNTTPITRNHTKKFKKYENFNQKRS